MENSSVGDPLPLDITERIGLFAALFPRRSLNLSGFKLEFNNDIEVPKSNNDWVLFIIYGCIMCTLNILGIITNCITIYVFTRYPTKSSTYMLLQIMAAADSMFLIFSILNLSIPNIYNFVSSYTSYLETWVHSLQYLKGFHEISRDYAVWMVAIITVDRYIGICHPMKATRINTVRHAVIVAVGLLLLLAAFNVPMFMLIKVIEKTSENGQLTWTNSDLAKDETFSKIYFITDAVINLLVPIVFVITMNGAIIKVITRASQQRSAMTRQLSENTKHSYRTNIMLVIVAILFVLCEVPKIVEQVLYFTGRELTFVEYENNIPLPVGVASEFLQNFNSFVNFYVYCLVGKKFQRIMGTMCGCHCKCCGGHRLSTNLDSSINKTMSFRLTTIKKNRLSSEKSNGQSSA
ncbi:FMRFamide receptor-like [Lineus longissimus]|uniref:FMRFamide receptor-like n=1 Tax=Lineus longissimus TaxID=88925 RepID=UPI00315CBB1E